MMCSSSSVGLTTEADVMVSVMDGSGSGVGSGVGLVGSGSF